MHIDTIKITNFRGIETFEATGLTPTAPLYGPNGAGKTTILDAVRFALTGLVRDQTGASIKLERLVGPWGDRGEVTVGLTDGTTDLGVTVKFNAKTSTLTTKPPIPGKIAEQRAAIWQTFGLSPEREALALDPLALLLGDDLLSGLSGNASIDDTAFNTLFGKQSDKVRDLLKRYRLTLNTASDLEPIALALYDVRAKVNREAKALDGAITTAGAVTQPTGKNGKPVSEDDIPNIQKRIQECRVEQGRLEERIAQTSNAISEAEKNKQVTRLKTRLSELQKCPPKHDPEPVPDPCPVDDPSALAKDIQAADAARRNAISRLSALGEVCDTCPTCKRAMDPDAIEAQTQAIDAAEHAVQEATQCHAALEAEWQAYQDWKTITDTDRATWEAKTKRVQQDYDADLAQVKADLQRLNALTPSVDVDTLHQDLAKTQATAEAGQALIDKIRLYEQYKANQTELARLTQDSEFLTWVYKILQDPATAATLGGDDSLAFCMQMNDVLGMFGYRVRVNWEAGTIELSEDAVEQWRPVAEASAGELTLLQVAVADVYGGSGLALIDRFEGVDGDNMQQVMCLLRMPVGGRVLAMTAESVELKGIACVRVG